MTAATPPGRATHPLHDIPVLTAHAARALDASTIAALHGDSLRLMRQAGDAIADWLLATLLPGQPVALYAGPGNNGGDGWIAAARLRAAGIPVRLREVAAPRTGDARAARDAALADGPFPPVHGDEPVGIDAVLGTGARTELAPDIVAACAQLQAHRTRIAIDLPTGVDATTGTTSPDAVHAQVTLALGSVKHGHLAARELCGEVVVLDIGLTSADAAWPRLVTDAWLPALLPPLSAHAHKGLRGRVRVVGGSRGMAGAVVLAARAAQASGAGLVQCTVAPDSLHAVQVAAPFATASTLSAADADAAWAPAHAQVIGPGLDTTALPSWWAALLSAPRPTVLDAGALRLLARAPDTPVGPDTVLTPHAGEAEALGAPARAPGDAASTLAQRFGCVVLAKGVPTVVAVPDGRSWVVPAGNLALATGGSGDILAGIIGTLLAQGVPTHHAAVLGALAHGRAATLAVARHGGWRGVTLDLLLDALAAVWHLPPAPRVTRAVLATLPALPDA